MAELVNQYKDRLTAIPGTRILEADLGVLGVRIFDTHDANRVWEIQGLYTPIEGRVLGGLRAKLIDQKNFVTFCNQRDLEVLLGLARPGSFCSWGDCAYVDPEEQEWCGFCCDEEDLRDDLFERELLLRAQIPGGVLTTNLDIERRVHLDKLDDHEDLFVLLGDYDPETGMFPDPRFETVERRWIRSERKRVRWARS